MRIPYIIQLICNQSLIDKVVKQYRKNIVSRRSEVKKNVFYDNKSLKKSTRAIYLHCISDKMFSYSWGMIQKLINCCNNDAEKSLSNLLLVIPAVIIFYKNGVIVPDGVNQIRRPVLPNG